MKIFGHPWMESETFYSVESIEEIKRTPPNALLHIESLSEYIELVSYCQKNSLMYALKISEIKEAIFANNLGAKYLLCSKDLAKELTPIAQNYLFDTQIIAYITDESEIAEMAKAGVDGVKFR
jgi:hypothetical protein